jgi:peptide/nickel transport system permease protein
VLAYIARRLVATLPVVGTVAIVVFAILRLTPGDPAAIIAGDSATSEQLQQIRAHMGLDKPVVVQFFLWLAQLLSGDLGISLVSQVPVFQLIADRIGPTIALATSIIAFSVIVAIPLGVLAAWRQGTLLDRLVSAFAVFGFSVPVFVIGYLLILLFSIQLG